MDLDIRGYLDQLNMLFNEFVQKAQRYFQSLDLYEKIAWGAEGVGLVLVILALILW